MKRSRRSRVPATSGLAREASLQKSTGMFCRGRMLCEDVTGQWTGHLNCPERQLAPHHVGGLEPFRSLEQVKLDHLALIQAAITVFLNSGKVHEHILPGGPLNEAIPLGSIEPFHCTLLSHNSTPFASAQRSLSATAGVHERNPPVPFCVDSFVVRLSFGNFPLNSCTN